MNITKVAYQKYQLDWMIQHGRSLMDLVAELQIMIDEWGEDVNLKSLFEDLEYGYGFSQEIWACYNEFMDIEFCNEEYMKRLLDATEFNEYEKYMNEEYYKNVL